MNFDWNPEQKERRKAVKALLDKEGKAELEELEGARRDRGRAMLLAWQARLAGAGYLDPGVGPEGRQRRLDLVAAQGELARASGSLFIAVEATARLFAGLVLGQGSDRVRELLEADLSQGDLIGALSLAKAGDKVTAAAAGEGWTLDGRLSQVINARIADWLVVPAEAEAGRVLALVRPSDRGVIVGPRLPTLGFDGLHIAPVSLDEAFVPVDQVMGPFTDFKVFLELRQIETLTLALASIGLMHRCLDAAKSHARSHSRDGKPLSKHQEVGFKLAEMLTLTQTAQWMTFRAAWLGATGDREGSVVLDSAKVFASESAERVASLGLQVVGGEGYTRGNPLERAWREARFAPVVGVTTDEGRDAIARDLLARHAP